MGKQWRYKGRVVELVEDLVRVGAWLGLGVRVRVRVRVRARVRARAGAGAMARVRAKVSLTVITPNHGRSLLTLNLNCP